MLMYAGFCSCVELNAGCVEIDPVVVYFSDMEGVNGGGEISRVLWILFVLILC